MSHHSRVGTSLDLDGLRPGDRILVSYDSDASSWMHERLCLAQVGPRRWIMATPHFDVYEEDLDEYASVYPMGKLGGIHASLQDRDRVKFKNDELRTRLSALLVDGEADAQGLREPSFVPNGSDSASREARRPPAAALGSTTNLRAFSTVHLVVPDPHSI